MNIAVERERVFTLKTFEDRKLTEKKFAKMNLANVDKPKKVL